MPLMIIYLNIASSGASIADGKTRLLSHFQKDDRWNLKFSMLFLFLFLFFVDRDVTQRRKELTQSYRITEFKSLDLKMWLAPRSLYIYRYTHTHTHPIIEVYIIMSGLQAYKPRPLF